LLAAAFRSTEPRLVRVRRDACDACRQAAATSQGRWTPVVASLIYDRTSRELDGEAAERDRLSRLKLEADCRLRLLPELINPGSCAIGVTGPGERRLAAAPARGRRLTWSVAVLTAPRRRPTLEATLAGLAAAGFNEVRLFAEPGSRIPASAANLPVVRHSRQQGQLRNFCFAAENLLRQDPAADCYAVFEDDIAPARGLRGWCDGQFWPGGHGVVSLFTSRVMSDDRVGWQTLNLGRYRTFGCQAFVFQGAALREFLADEVVRRHLARGHPGADAVLGEWALMRGVGIAYHSPSPVQHVGDVSSIDRHQLGRVGPAVAVGDVEEIPAWRPPPARFGRVGLVGWNTASGLGYQNRDIAIHLPVDRWLAPQHPHYARLERPPMPGEYRAASSPRARDRTLDRWFGGLDWLLFVEQPYIYWFAQVAREKGISVACVPNWEWLTTSLDWLPYVDLMICPTRTTFNMLRGWRQDLGFAFDVVYAPWAIDAGRFPFRRRERCRRFLFVNGTAGVWARRPDGSKTLYRRKGAELIAATARLLKSVPFIVYSQDPTLPPMPANVEVRPPPRDNADLYRDGDVCVQPSHWEGLGLQLLECQAAGLPLVTTDAPPMNEVRSFRAVPADESELVFVLGDQPVDAHLIRPEVLADVLNDIYGADVREASESARTYIERERSWPRLRELLTGWLTA
jgi:hypothetical protein